MDEALAFIESHRTPSLLVYIAIGCAQGRYPPGEHSPQEYPPFIRNFHIGHRVVLLIDPELEDPPRALADNPDAVAAGTVTFFPIRSYLNWEPTTNPNSLYGPHLLRTLLTLRPPPDFIVVQDYTGIDIAPYDPYIPGRVLFDATYGDYGCFVDFTRHTHIPRDPATGAILHLNYLPLRAIPIAIYPDLYRRQREARASDLRFYIHRYIRVLRGQAPDADWCSSAEVARRQARLDAIYRPRTCRSGSMEDLADLATYMLLDFGVPANEIPALIADPTGEQLSKVVAATAATESRAHQ